MILVQVMFHLTMLFTDHDLFQELEEENEHVNEDLRNMTLQHKRLQEAYDALKKQLSTPTTNPVVCTGIL